MRFSKTLAAAAIVAIAAAAPAPASPTATDAADVQAAAATAGSESPTSKVKGKVFDRYVSIWLENNDFDVVKNDRM
jgi:acid phosphatase